MTNWIMVLRLISQLNSKMKQNGDLEVYFNDWLKSNYNMESEVELLDRCEGEPDILVAMAKHWKSIRKKWC